MSERIQKEGLTKMAATMKSIKPTKCEPTGTCAIVNGETFTAEPGMNYAAVWWTDNIGALSAMMDVMTHKGKRLPASAIREVLQFVQAGKAAPREMRSAAFKTAAEAKAYLSTIGASHINAEGFTGTVVKMGDVVAVEILPETEPPSYVEDLVALACGGELFEGMATDEEIGDIAQPPEQPEPLLANGPEVSTAELLSDAAEEQSGQAEELAKSEPADKGAELEPPAPGRTAAEQAAMEERARKQDESIKELQANAARQRAALQAEIAKAAESEPAPAPAETEGNKPPKTTEPTAKAPEPSSKGGDAVPFDDFKAGTKTPEGDAWLAAAEDFVRRNTRAPLKPAPSELIQRQTPLRYLPEESRPAELFRRMTGYHPPEGFIGGCPKPPAVEKPDRSGDELPEGVPARIKDPLPGQKALIPDDDNPEGLESTDVLEIVSGPPEITMEIQEAAAELAGMGIGIDDGEDAAGDDGDTSFMSMFGGEGTADWPNP